MLVGPVVGLLCIRLADEWGTDLDEFHSLGMYGCGRSDGLLPDEV